MPKRPFVPALVTTILLAGAFMPLSAQRKSEWEFSCSRNRSSYDDRERACNTIDQTIPARGKLLVDSRTNGGIIVIGENRRDIQIHAVVEAHARSQSRADAMVEEVRIRTDEGRITADGPGSGSGRNEWWSVNFEVHVPMNTDLDLMAQNGGIAIAQVTGMLRMETENGGIHLDGVNGDVVAETTNGGIHVDLDGVRWEGKGLDATTTNGGVHVNVPDNYSAHLETSTTNGGMEIDFPVTVQGRIGRRISADLGKGGPTIRVTTTNGGVTIAKGR